MSGSAAPVSSFSPRTYDAVEAHLGIVLVLSNHAFSSYSFCFVSLRFRIHFCVRGGRDSVEPGLPQGRGRGPRALLGFGHFGRAQLEDGLKAVGTSWCGRMSTWYHRPLGRVNRGRGPRARSAHPGRRGADRCYPRQGRARQCGRPARPLAGGGAAQGDFRPPAVFVPHAGRLARTLATRHTSGVNTSAGAHRTKKGGGTARPSVQKRNGVEAVVQRPQTRRTRHTENQHGPCEERILPKHGRCRWNSGCTTCMPTVNQDATTIRAAAPARRNASEQSVPLPVALDGWRPTTIVPTVEST